MKKSMLALALMLSLAQLRAQDTTRLSLLFLGDIMQHDSQIADAYNPLTKKYDYNPCFQFVKRYTQSADLAIGNLELTLAGPPYKGYPQFSAPDELLFALKDMGMDVLVTANNHCVDTGKKGLERTIQMLDSLRIPHTGTFVDDIGKLNDHPLLIRKNDFTLALLNYTYGTNGLPVTSPNIVNMIDTTAIRKDLRHAQGLRADIIIVFVHWGAEYQSLPSKWQQTVAEFCFNHGAQLVIGAHPHVIQPMQWRKEKNQLVAYSLGNFVSGQRKRYTDGGAMINVELMKLSYGHDSSETRIDTASYVLEWVYRSQVEKNYYVLPVPTFEKDTGQFIRDSSSNEAFKLFISDSRNLLGKHNINVPECKVVPGDTLVRYKVLFFAGDKNLPSDSLVFPAFAPIFNDLAIEEVETGKYYYMGDFSRRNEAERWVDIIRANGYVKGYMDPKVVTFVNGNKKD